MNSRKGPARMHHYKQKVDLRFLANRGRALLRHPLFILLTTVGNGFVLVFALVFALVFYLMERNVNPRLENFVDALWWSIATVTTVGYGDVSPVTILGKLAGMCLMIFGTALFGAFTALFATILLEPEISEVEEEVRELEKNFGKR